MIRYKSKRRFAAVFLCSIFIASWFSNMFPALADEASGEAEGGNVASITTDGDTKYYTTLQAAINAVPNGGTIEMLASTKENVSSSSKSYTLNMNGKTIDGDRQDRVYKISGGTVNLNDGTLTNGYVTGYATTAHGAGLDISGNANVTLDGMTITKNSAARGGGVYYNGIGELTIENSTISYNTSDDNGGGVYAWGVTSYDWLYGYSVADVIVTLTNVDFEYNYAKSDGAALGLSRIKTVNVSGCDFYKNHCDIEAADSSIISIDHDISTGTCSFYSECTITENYDSRHTFYVSGSDYFDYYGNIGKINLTLDDCEISGNSALYTGGIYMSEHSEVTLQETIIKSNTVTKTPGENAPVSGGVNCYNTTSNKLTISSGAVYDNTSENSDANDLFIGKSTTVNIIAASAMVDEESIEDLKDYAWRKSDRKFIDSGINSTTSALDSDLELTAFYAPGPPEAEYNEKVYPSIYDENEEIVSAIDKAKEDGFTSDSEEPAEIKLLHGKNKKGEDVSDFFQHTVTVDIPVLLDMNGISLTAKDDVLFDIKDGGSLTLSGKGEYDGPINVADRGALILDTETESDLDIDLASENSVLEIGGDFVSCGALNVTLHENGAADLNKTPGDIPDDIKVLIVKNGEALKDKDGNFNVELTNVTNPRVKFEIIDGDLYAVNHSLANGLFVKSNGNDENNGSLNSPLATIDKALELLKEKGSGEIYILDTITVNTKSEELVWDGSYGEDGKQKAVIERYSDSKELGNINSKPEMFKVTGSGSLELKNITIDGGGDIYTYAGSIIDLASSSSLTIGSGATLCNNDIVSYALVGNTVDRATYGSGYEQYSGGAIFNNRGNIIINDGAVIKNCTAIMGGAIYCENGSTITMNGGEIVYNTAAGRLGTAEIGTASSDYYDASGGGINIMGNSSLMKMSGGSINYNSAINGGGLSLGNGNYDTCYKMESEKAQITTNFEMTDGEFIGNTSNAEGGAVYVQCSHKAEVTGGLFEANEAHGGNFGGGAFYVNGGKHVNGGTTYVSRVADGQLWLTKVLISGNESAYNGGGIAGCNTSGVVVNMSDGSVIYENYGGDDLCDVSVATSGTNTGDFSGGKDSETQDYFTLFMLDGTPYHWRYARNTGKFSRGDYVSEDYLDSKTGKCMYTEEVPAEGTIENEIKVKIINNTSRTTGAGIGTNGTVYIGGEYKNPSEFTVYKMWENIDDRLLADPPNWLDDDDEDELAKFNYPAALEQLNIWVLILGEDENGETYVQNKTYNPMLSRYVDQFGYPSPYYELTNTGFVAMYKEYIIVLEDAIYKDGRHVWSVDDYEGYQELIDDAIEDIMSTMYPDGDLVWSHDDDSPFTTTVVTNDDDSITFINRVNYGDLEVTKTVAGDEGDTDEEFHFTVTLGNNEITGKYGDMEFTDGVAEFTLKDGESKIAINLPAGITYIVEEAEANENGYVTTSEGAEGTIPAKPVAAEPSDTEPDDTEQSDTKPGKAVAEFVNVKQTDSITVKKAWEGVDGEGHPDFVTVQLYKDGEPYGDPVILSEENDWYYEWTHIWKKDNDVHEWDIKELDLPDDYRATVTRDDTGKNLTLTNTKLTSVSVNKVWDDDDSADRPGSVTVQLNQDGKAYGEPVTLSEENNWKYTWKELEKAHEWTVEEVEVPDGYTAETTHEGNDWTITNTKEEEPEIPEPDLTSVSVKKVWVDGDSADRPGSVTVQLNQDGEAYGELVTLSEENSWTYTWTELEEEYEWTVEEVNVPDGYTAKVAHEDNDWTITNTKDEEPEIPEPELTSVSVKKVWVDDNSADRPESVTVQLYQDGKAYGELVTLSEDSDWTYTWTDLEKDHEWTVEEVDVPDGYHMSASHDDNDWTITNTKDDEPDDSSEVDSSDVDSSEVDSSDIDSSDVDSSENDSSDVDSSESSKTDSSSSSSSNSSSSSDASSGIKSGSYNTNNTGSNDNPSTGTAAGNAFMLFAVVAAAALVVKKKR